MSADEAVGDQVKPVNEIHIHLDDGRKVDWSKVPVSLLWPSMIAAVALATEAVAEDYKRHYKKALTLYKESEKHFLYAINHDAKTDDAKVELQKKLKPYQDRATTLNAYLEERRGIEKLRELTNMA